MSSWNFDCLFITSQDKCLECFDSQKKRRLAHPRTGFSQLILGALDWSYQGPLLMLDCRTSKVFNSQKPKIFEKVRLRFSFSTHFVWYVWTKSFSCYFASIYVKYDEFYEVKQPSTHIFDKSKNLHFRKYYKWHFLLFLFINYCCHHSNGYFFTNKHLPFSHILQWSIVVLLHNEMKLPAAFHMHGDLFKSDENLCF